MDLPGSICASGMERDVYMNERWDDLGKMDKIVQKAIKSGNYSSLENDINNIVGRFTSKLENIIDKGINSANSVSMNVDGGNIEINKGFQNLRRKEKNLPANVSPYISDGKLLGRGLSGTIGGCMAFGLGIGFAASPLEGDITAVVVMATMFLPSLLWFIDGMNTFKERLIFKNYQKVLELSNNKSFAKIEELMNETGESKKKTLKRIRKMIRKRWFKEGHIDKNETTLISTNKTYSLYLQTQSEFEERQKMEKELGFNLEKETLNAEVQATLAQGKKYLGQISHLNDIIPGIEVSNKIYKIEGITGKILARVEEHPENAEDIKQLMKYYLPMTIKLLTAYAEMDSQPVSTEDIEKSKKEIENTLDSLNEAFKRLLGNLYKDTAWDVSSDVSVLNAMLKREGLKGEDFTNVTPNKGDNKDIKLTL